MKLTDREKILLGVILEGSKGKYDLEYETFAKKIIEILDSCNYGIIIHKEHKCADCNVKCDVNTKETPPITRREI